MKIVVLDGYTLNPGDLSWANLKELGDVIIYERTPTEKILERASGAEILFTNKTPLRAETIAQLPELKYIGVLATGYDVVDVKAARERDIPVTNVPTYGTDSVAQMVFSHLLEICQHVKEHSDTVKEGGWEKSDDFCFWDYPLIELVGKTMGIVGFGRIGQRVAEIAEAFGMKVIAYDKYQNDDIDLNFQWVELEQLFKKSDVISLHCPLFPETEGIINNDSLKLMKDSALLINTSRGKLVKQDDLADALNKGQIAGAGLDVLAVEPPTADNPLMTAANCHITPHIAWATREARGRLMKTAIDNLKEFIAGNETNIVN